MKDFKAKVLMHVAGPISGKFQNICKHFLIRPQSNKISYEGSETDDITSQFGL